MSTRTRSSLALPVLHRQFGELVEGRLVKRQPGPRPDADEDQHHDQRDHADGMPPERAHGETPSPCRWATRASSSLLPSTACAAAAMSPSEYGSPSARTARIFASMSLPSTFTGSSHR